MGGVQYAAAQLHQQFTYMLQTLEAISNQPGKWTFRLLHESLTYSGSDRICIHSIWWFKSNHKKSDSIRAMNGDLKWMWVISITRCSTKLDFIWRPTTHLCWVYRIWHNWLLTLVSPTVFSPHPRCFWFYCLFYELADHWLSSADGIITIFDPHLPTFVFPKGMCLINYFISSFLHYYRISGWKTKKRPEGRWRLKWYNHFHKATNLCHDLMWFA